ncbi:MAG TPA: phosphoribosylglycinamide formyltransferase [Longimicrobiales bacterium]|nr:phosphoribosylglycinamide formyltransferase [Longimicrobiales bacterium]
MTLRLAVFASGGGSNLQALIDRFNRAGSDSDVRVSLVISDRADAPALARARAAGIEAMHIQVSGRPADLSKWEMLTALDSADIDLIALAGYLRLMPAAVIRRYPRRIVNIHPALLPRFGGKGMYGRNVHQAVLDAGEKVSGATVHFVNENYDEGDIITQKTVPVLPGDTAESLAARVLEVEHVLLPDVLEQLARSILAEEPNA